jgi:thiosulfate/3-mercaptopyruvate sulfurtransferase
MQPLGARGLIDEVVALARTVCPIYTERDDAMGTGEYARPELLTEPDWVWEHRSETSVRVVDCGPEAACWRAHVPGAILLPIDPWLKDSGDGMHVIGPDAVVEVMSTLGVEEGVTVVIYDDDENAMLATRLWWVLAYYGHENASILNGGWRRWIAEGRPIASGEEPPPKRSQFVGRPNEELIARLGDIRSAVERGDVQVLDVRPRSYWEGSANPFGNRRIGHIPGAANVDSGAFLLHQPPYTFKGAEEIEALVRDVGMSPKRETIVHCQAGVRTTTGVFALALLGWTNVRAYDAAMAEWANRDDTPLVVEEGVALVT